MTSRRATGVPGAHLTGAHLRLPGHGRHRRRRSRSTSTTRSRPGDRRASIGRAGATWRSRSRTCRRRSRRSWPPVASGRRGHHDHDGRRQPGDLGLCDRSGRQHRRAPGVVVTTPVAGPTAHRLDRIDATSSGSRRSGRSCGTRSRTWRLEARGRRSRPGGRRGRLQRDAPRYGGRPGEIEIESGRRDRKIEIRILDRAPTFDPTAAPSPDVTRPPGRDAARRDGRRDPPGANDDGRGASSCPSRGRQRAHAGALDRRATAEEG